MQVGDIFSAEIDTPAQFDDYTEAGFPFAIIGFNDANGNEVFNIEAGSSVVYGDFPWRYDDLNHTNGDFGVDAGGTSIAPTATSDGATFSLEVLTPTTGRFTFDGVSLDITFGLIVGGTPTPAGPPASVFFTAFDNNGEEDDMGNPTGEHAFFFDNLQIDRPAAGLPGDYNGNNSVDAADYVLWRGGGPLQNEVATPGSVTPEYYDEWRARFGNSSPASGSSLGSPAGVPEPSALLLAACTALACFASRSVRRK